MDGSSAANSVTEIARIALAFVITPILVAPVLVACLCATALSVTSARADVSVRNCPPELTTIFNALLELELSAAARAENALHLTCHAERAVVQVRGNERELERSISLDTVDAGRWLALAAAELVGRAQEPKHRPAAVPTPRSEPALRAFTLRVAARARLADEPLMLRAGAELGVGFAPTQVVWLAASLRFGTGTRAVGGAVRVRGSDASLAFAAGYTFPVGRLRLLPGLGLVAGVTRLTADSNRAQLQTRSLTRGFAGPLVLVRTQWELHEKAWLELGLEAAYTQPSIEGRDESRRVLFTQTPWYTAASLGVSIAL